MALSAAEKQQAYRGRKEQELKDEFGYVASESRTAVERHAAARRIVSQSAEAVETARAILTVQAESMRVPSREADDKPVTEKKGKGAART